MSNDTPRRSRLKIALALLAGTSLLAIAGAEAYLRYFHPVEHMQPPDPANVDDWRDLLHRESSVPGLAYELAPNMKKFAQKVDVQTNSLGMRDEEPRELEAATSSRIVALGDSFTFGFGAELKDVWPMRLEAKLDQLGLNGGRPVDVLNFGVGGYGTIDEALVLQHKALAWRPDLVILAYFLNDPEDEPIQPLHAHYVPPRWWQHSHLLRLLHYKLKEREMNALGGGDYHLYLHASPSKWRGVLEAFADMRRMTTEAGSELILMIFPQTPKKQWKGYKYEALHAKVAEAGRAAGMQVLDLLPVYKQHEPVSLRVSNSDGHPSALGHELAAQVLVDFLQAHPEFLINRDER